MKTTIDIPDNDLKEAMRHLHTRTKREVVVTALREFNRRNRMAALAADLGTFKDFITREELDRLREER